MAYGKYGSRTSRTGKRTGTASRRSALRSAKTLARRQLVKKRRASYAPNKARATNTRAILSNARAIQKLKFNQWGRIQSQTSSTSDKSTVVSSAPLVFHVSNPNSNHHGPYIWQPDLIGLVQDTHVNFQIYQGDSNADMQDNDVQNFPNGPVCKLLWASYQFKFTGFVDDTRIRIDFIRQKRIDTDFYNQNKAKQFLPHTLVGMKHLAGFSPNEIDKTKFTILKTKYLYLNSKGAANLEDTLQDRNTTDATTTTSKYCKVSLKLNKIIKQLNSTVFEQHAYEVENHNAQESDHPHGSTWAFDNQHPLSNIWCVISTDDQTSLGDVITGDAVKVEIIRKMTWQDRL